MTTVATLAAALAALVLIALTIRVSVELEIECREMLRTHLRVRWLGKRIHIGSSSDRPLRVKPAAAAKASGVSARRWLSVMRTPGLGPRVWQLGRDLTRCATVDGAHAQGEFGCDDPADTGRIYGVMTPAVVWARAQGYDLRVRPVFDEAVVRGSGGARVSFRPINMVGACLSFLLTPALLRGVARYWARRG